MPKAQTFEVILGAQDIPSPKPRIKAIPEIIVCRILNLVFWAPRFGCFYNLGAPLQGFGVDIRQVWNLFENFVAVSTHWGSFKRGSGLI